MKRLFGTHLAMCTLAVVLFLAGGWTSAQAQTNTVSAGSSSNCLTTTQTCSTIPIQISRTDATPILAYSVTFTLSANLALCAPLPNVPEGTYLSASGPTSYHVVNLGGGQYRADDVILGAANCGSTGAAGTLFSVHVTNTGGSGTGTVTINSVTLRNCSNVTIASTVGSNGSVAIDLTPVTVDAISDPTVAETAPLSVTPVAHLSSCASGPVNWTATGLPPGASINPSSGEVTWTPGCTAYENGPDYGPVTVTAHAASLESGSASFTIHVTNSPGTVAVSVGSSFSVEEQSALVMAAPVATLSGCAVGPVTWSVSPPLPPGASLNASGQVVWTPSCGDANSYGPFTLTATAATGEFGSNAFSLVVTHKVGTVSVSVGSSFSVEEQSALVMAAPLATLGPCAAGPVTWSVSPPLPPGASLNASGQVVWTPSCGDANSYGPFSLTATAATGEFGAGSFSLVVTHKVGTVSVSVGSSFSVEEQSALVMAAPLATLGPCAAGPVTWSVSPSLPPGASLNASGQVVWTPSCGDANSYGPFTLTATATTGEFGSNAFSLVVTHKVGTVSVSVGSSFSVEEQSALVMAAPLATLGPCAAGPVTWSVSPPLPPGASLNASGQVVWTPSCGDANSYGPFTLTATATTGEFGSNAFSLVVTHKVGTVSIAAISDPTVAEGALLTVTPVPTLGPCAATPLTWSASGLPAGASIDTGSGVITWTPPCDAFELGGLYGPVSVTATAATAEFGSTSFSIHVTNTPIAIAAVSPLAAVQGPGAGSGAGLSGITISYATPPGATSVEVYRAGFGNYPEYDDAPNSGSVPAPPSYPPSSPWVLTSVTASGQVDMPAARDFWYYVAFAKNACGDVSPVSVETSGTLDYRLGDVTDGFVVGTGDNLVNTPDISYLGAHYGLFGAAVTPYNLLDVGPTSTGYIDGRPLTDNEIGFEDLVIVAINYGRTTFPRALPAGESNGSPGVAEVILARADRVTAGAVVTAELQLRGAGSLAALSARLSWDAAVVEPVSCEAVEWFRAQGGIVLSPKPGTIDAALLGAAGVSGEGPLATMTFRAISAGDPKIRLESVDGRDAMNRSLVVNRSEASPTVDVPATTQFAAPSPSPFHESTTLSFSLAQGGPVELSIYSVAGRRVKTLLRDTREPGNYRLIWDGRDDGGQTVGAGVYYAYLASPQGRFTRALVHLR